MSSPKDVYTFYNPETKIWSGLPKKPIFNPDQGIGDLMFQALERNPDKVVQINADTDEKMTGAEMRLHAIRIAQNLARKGYGSSSQSEDIIFTMILRNEENTASLLFACFALGIPVNTLDPLFGQDDMSHVLSTVQPKLVFCESDILEKVNSACKVANLSPEIIVMGDPIDGYDNVENLVKPTGNEAVFIPTQIANPAEQLAVLLCSSGTTGRPKAVGLPHSICIAHMANFFPCQPSDRTIAFSTLFWLSGMLILLTSTVWGATRIITRKPFNPELALNIIERFQVSAIVLPSTHARDIVQCQKAKAESLRSLRFPFAGGSIVPASLKESFEKLIPGRFLEVAYGFTEIALGVTFTKGELYRRGSAGFPVAGTEFKIVNEKGQPLANGEQGEILVRSNYAFKGYFGNAQATSEFRDIDGWLHSGDIGKFDDDGYLYVVDRKKDTIMSAKFRIFPSEIETVIQDILGVEAVCVVGVPILQDELATALVVRKSSAEDEDKVKAEINKKVKEVLPDYKHLSGGIYFTDKLPLTVSGKVMRGKVREIIVQKKSEDKKRKHESE